MMNGRSGGDRGGGGGATASPPPHPPTLTPPPLDLDGRLTDKGSCTQLVFPDGAAPSVSLLYRPGHYDILYEVGSP